MSEETKVFLGMTKQEVLDKVVAHMMEQKGFSLDSSVRSVSGFPDCRYRGPNGLKCAVGALIPDEEYGSWMEGEAAFVVVSMASPGTTPISAKHDVFLLDIQGRLHDYGRYSKGWDEAAFKRRVEVFCNEYGLTNPLASTEVTTVN